MKKCFFLEPLYKSIIIFLGGNEMCCSILQEYPDFIPTIVWPTGITAAEKMIWGELGCDNEVGGSSKDQCTGIIII